MRGRYVWDDDNLRPGQKKEGGLHQNLFDAAGNLKGSARFIPDTGAKSERLVVTETEYVSVEQRRENDDALQMVINALVGRLLDHGIAIARPLAQRWWRDTARPALDSRRERLSERRKRRAHTDETTSDDAATGSPNERKPVPAGSRPTMSRAEAQARYLAALAAQAYSEEQLRLIAVATIANMDDMTELEQSLSDLPVADLRNLVESMATNPAMLSEETLAQLASVLGRNHSTALPPAVRPSAITDSKDEPRRQSAPQAAAPASRGSRACS